MYKRILVPLDDSEGSANARDFAVRWSQSCGASIRLVHYIDLLAFPNEMGYGQPVIETARQYAQAMLDREQSRLRAQGVQAETQLFLPKGKRLGECIADDARAWRADLIALGSHGRRGISRLLLGSGAEQIIREAPVPALVVRGKDLTPTLQRVLVAVDGSETSAHALAAAVQLSRDCGAELRLVHSVGELAYLGAYGWADSFMEETQADADKMLQRARELANAADIPLQTFVSAGDQGLGEFVAQQVLAWNADLVVAGTHGRRGIRRAVLGSGAEQIIRLSPVSVLVTPAAMGASEGSPRAA